MIIFCMLTPFESSEVSFAVIFYHDMVISFYIELQLV